MPLLDGSEVGIRKDVPVAQINVEQKEWESGSFRMMNDDLPSEDTELLRQSVLMGTGRGMTGKGKNAKIIYTVNKVFHVEGWDENVADEIIFKTKKEADDFFEGEKEWLTYLSELDKKDVIWDGNRYFLKADTLERVE